MADTPDSTPDELERSFPRLRSGSYAIKSRFDRSYNCVAWAVGDTTRWWWPSPQGGIYWPPGVPRVPTYASFEAAFAFRGYAPCDSMDLEGGVEKIVVYVDASGNPQHAARQRDDGVWVSKLGRDVDIEHATLDLIENDAYGKAAWVFCRPKEEEPGVRRPRKKAAS